MEEGQSERHQKFRELKKREETMENFMSNFDKSMKDEKLKIEKLQNDIVFALEHISLNIDQLHFSELDNLKQKHGVHNNILHLNDSEKSPEILIKDYGKLQEQLKKVSLIFKLLVFFNFTFCFYENLGTRYKRKIWIRNEYIPRKDTDTQTVNRNYF